ncbi:cell division protein FtsK, partial [Actinocrinis puniceicyclus]
TPQDEQATDLSEFVAAVRAANEQLGIPAQPRPWLPPLPATVLLDDLKPGRPGPSGLTPAPYALEDLPGQQRQRAAVLDLEHTGHLLIAGAPKSGRSQLLRTLAGSLAETNSPRDVQLYALDCGNGALLALKDVPHCGAVVRSSEPERAARLLTKLLTELRRRSDLLGARGHANLAEQRAVATGPDRLPYLVLLLDRWEGFRIALGELDNGAMTDQIDQLMREGAAAGIHLVVTGDRSALTARISTLADTKIALRMTDRTDYGLIAVNPRRIPDT